MWFGLCLNIFLDFKKIEYFTDEYFSVFQTTKSFKKQFALSSYSMTKSSQTSPNRRSTSVEVGNIRSPHLSKERNHFERSSERQMSCHHSQLQQRKAAPPKQG